MASRLPSSPLAVCGTSFKAVATGVVVRHDEGGASVRMLVARSYWRSIA
jgi:hypothetical protein